MRATAGSLYVAELQLPVALRGHERARQGLPEPEFFGVLACYWHPRSGSDDLGTPEPAGVTAVARLTAEDRGRAEQTAQEFGDRLQQLLAFYAGAPAEVSRLIRLARVSPDGVLEAQHDYFYEERLPPATDFSPQGATAFLRVIGLQGAAGGQQLETGVRWYSIALAQNDPIDQFIAAWIGLEAIGPRLSERFHPSGVKARCEVCGNESGKERNRKFAGMKHVIGLVAPDAVDILGEPKDVRDKLLHGRSAPNEQRAFARGVAPDLLLALAKGVLTLSASSSDADVWEAALPRDYELRPDARYDVELENTPVVRRPWRGEWIGVEREFANRSSRVEPETGQYVLSYQIRIQTTLTDVEERRGIATTQYVEYERAGVDARQVEIREGQRVTEREWWRPYPPTSAWARIIREADV